MQLSWFIAQIITRAVQGFAITEIELTTAALAGLNSVMYVFWWSNPRDVRFSVVIRTKGVEELLAKKSEDITWSFSDSEAGFDFRRHLWLSFTMSTKEILNSLAKFLVSLSGTIVCALSNLARVVKILPRNLHSYFSNLYRKFVRTYGDLKGSKSVELMRTRDNESYVALEVVDLESPGETRVSSDRSTTKDKSLMSVSILLNFLYR